MKNASYRIIHRGDQWILQMKVLCFYSLVARYRSLPDAEDAIRRLIKPGQMWYYDQNGHKL